MNGCVVKIFRYTRKRNRLKFEKTNSRIIGIFILLIFFKIILLLDKSIMNLVDVI